MDVPGALAEALKDVYPYTYFVKAWEVGGGYNGNMLLSKYEILETKDIVLNPGTPDDSSDEGRAFLRAMLNVNGATVDVFFGWMKGNMWGDFAPYVKASEADAWVVTGYIAYASPEKSGIETALGQTISAAFEHYAITGGGYHFCNIISSANGTFSDVKREACSDRFGATADPLYQADITFDFT